VEQVILVGKQDLLPVMIPVPIATIKVSIPPLKVIVAVSLVIQGKIAKLDRKSVPSPLQHL